MFTTEVISLPESGPPANRLLGNSIGLHGHPFGGCTLLPPWDPVSLHLMFHSISPGFTLVTIGSGWRKRQMCLHQLTSPAFLKAPNFSKVRPTFKAAIVILVGAGERCWIRKRLFLNKKGS